MYALRTTGSLEAITLEKGHDKDRNDQRLGDREHLASGIGM